KQFHKIRRVVKVVDPDDTVSVGSSHIPKSGLGRLCLTPSVSVQLSHHCEVTVGLARLGRCLHRHEGEQRRVRLDLRLQEAGCPPGSEYGGGGFVVKRENLT